MKKAQFDPQKAVQGTSYPPPHDEPCQGRKTWPLTKLMDSLSSVSTEWN